MFRFIFPAMTCSENDLEADVSEEAAEIRPSTSRTNSALPPNANNENTVDRVSCKESLTSQSSSNSNAVSIKRASSLSRMLKSNVNNRVSRVKNCNYSNS